MTAPLRTYTALTRYGLHPVRVFPPSATAFPPTPERSRKRLDPDIEAIAAMLLPVRQRPIAIDGFEGLAVAVATRID